MSSSVRRKTNGDASESAIMKFCDGIAATHRGEAQYLKESPEVHGKMLMFVSDSDALVSKQQS